MVLLTIYVLIALGFSFLCSIAEAVILSVSPAYISVLENEHKPSGKLLAAQTQDINRPLAAILTLNTIAHTMGAAGAGAQAAVVFGDAYLGVISAILTLLILVFSEIIPKTLGATYWRGLAPVTAYFLKYLTIVLYPFVIMSQKLTSKMTGEAQPKGLSRHELHAVAELSAQEGQLAEHEHRFLQSLLSLHDLQVKDAMTHRTKVFSIPQDMTVEHFFAKHGDMHYSRIPVYEDGDVERVSGFVLRADLLVAQAKGNGASEVSIYRKSMVTLLGTMPLSATFDHFLSRQIHVLLVVDEYGGLEGILTLEDLLERLLGIDIIDETDNSAGMQRFARLLQARKKRSWLSRQQR